MAAVEASSAQPSAPADAQAGTPSNTAGAVMSRGDVNPALDAAALERIAKREAKKALKAARAAAAIEKRKRPLPWNEPAANPAEKKKRGWMSRLQEKNPDGSDVQAKDMPDFAPPAEALDPGAPHWKELRATLVALQEAAAAADYAPSWALTETKAGTTRKWVIGPVLASQLKTEMVKRSQRGEPGPSVGQGSGEKRAREGQGAGAGDAAVNSRRVDAECAGAEQPGSEHGAGAAGDAAGGLFDEQALGFRNFSAFLSAASDARAVALRRCPVHRGNTWVELPEWEHRLPAPRQEASAEAAGAGAGAGDSADKGAREGAGKGAGAGNAAAELVLVAGAKGTRSAKYVLANEAGAGAAAAAMGGVPRPLKLGRWALWDAMGRPRTVCAPMVEQSELPFRLLCRRYGTQLAYTPMIHSRLWVEDPNYRREIFSTCPADRPLVVQFCANDPDTLAAAVRWLDPASCDAVDLNLGCPQGIAKRGNYGSFLMDDLPLVHALISRVHATCDIPITAKIRVFPDTAQTLQYAKMCVDAGAQALTVHGRTRENKGAGATPADWAVIRAVKEHVPVPVIANGN